jgi:hypothetical protein
MHVQYVKDLIEMLQKDSEYGEVTCRKLDNGFQLIIRNHWPGNNEVDLIYIEPED